jgi:hypothetical protein
LIICGYQHSRFAALHYNFSGGKRFGSHGYHAVQTDQDQHEGELDMQPRRMKIVGRVRGDQADPR